MFQNIKITIVEDYFDNFCKEKALVPKLYAEYRYTELQRRLLHGDMEAFIGLEDELQEGIHFKKIRADKCYAVSRIGLFNSNTITVENLENKTVFLDDRNTKKNKELLSLLTEREINCIIQDRSPQAEIIRAVRNGFGILIVQESYARYFYRNLQISEIEGYTVNSGLYYKTITGKLLDYIDFIKKHID